MASVGSGPSSERPTGKALVRLAIPVCLTTALLAPPALAADARSPDAIALQVALERACLPLLTGGAAAPAATAAGLVRGRPVWRRTLAGGESLTLRPPGGSNPHVCTVRMTYRPGEAAGLVALLSAWSTARGLAPGKVKASSRGPVYERQTWTWAGRAKAGDMALVFAREQSLDGRPAANGLEQSEVLLSLTPARPAA